MENNKFEESDEACSEEEVSDADDTVGGFLFNNLLSVYIKLCKQKLAMFFSYLPILFVISKEEISGADDTVGVFLFNNLLCIKTM